MKPFEALKSKSKELFSFLKGIFSKKTLRRIGAELVNPYQLDGLKAFSAGLGIFVGIIPIWGLQTVIAIFVAITFRLNKTLTVIFSQVSLPPVFPLILLASYRIGHYQAAANIAGNIGSKVQQYLYGSITLAFAAGIAVGLITYLTLKTIRLIKQYGLSLKLKRGLVN